jgi:type VI secretion system secreted protein Hcp
MAAYLKYGEIKGESLAEAHKGSDGWIEISSVMWGCGRSIHTPVGNTSKREATAPNISEVTLTKSMDSTSPLLAQEALIGKGVDAVVELVQTSDSQLETFLSVKLTNALLSSYSMVSSGDRPQETITLNFTKIDYVYSGFDDKHKLDSSKKKNFIYDLAQAKQG